MANFCALTVDQHKALYKLVYKTVLDEQAFNLKDFVNSIYDKVFGASNNHELALTYLSYIPSYVSNLQTEDKDFRTILKASNTDANDLLDKIDEWENNLPNVESYIQKSAPVASNINLVNKTKDIKDEVTEEKLGEKNYQDYNIKFPDGGKSIGRVEDGVAYISGINAPTVGSETKRGTKTYERVLNQLYNNGVKTIKITLQSADSRVAIQKLLDKGILINPRELSGVSIDEFPTKFDINSENLNTSLKNNIPTIQEVKGNLQRATDKNSLTKVLEDTFNLPEVQASAVATIYDRVAQSAADRTNTTPRDFYNSIAFKRASEGELTNPLFQFDTTNLSKEIDAVDKISDNYLKAPNGNPTNLTPEQWIITQTPSFKTWFGNIDKNKKIVEDNFDRIVKELNISKKC